MKDQLCQYLPQLVQMESGLMIVAFLIISEEILKSGNLSLQVEIFHYYRRRVSGQYDSELQ